LGQKDRPAKGGISFGFKAEVFKTGFETNVLG